MDRGMRRCLDPSAYKRTIEISNLNVNTSLFTIKYLLFGSFVKHGCILEVNVPGNFHKTGSAFVAYASPSSAMKAITVMSGLYLLGQEIEVKFARRESIVVKTLRNFWDPLYYIDINRFRGDGQPDRALSLVVTNYPKESEQSTMNRLNRFLNSHLGFQSVRVESDTAYADFEDDLQVIGAQYILDGYKITEYHELRTYIKPRNRSG